jgi:hypothetical protein
MEDAPKEPATVNRLLTYVRFDDELIRVTLSGRKYFV